MQNNLPSKKFFIFLVIIVFIALFFLFKNKLFPKTVHTPEQEKFLNTTITEFAVTDTDKDGLYDWEEALWATDPNKADTDNDGINDKTYVQQQKSELGITESDTKENESLTETERISMEFFTVISSLEQKGLLSPDAIENIGEIFSQQISDPIVIEESSINTDFRTTDNSKESISAYKTAVFEVFKKSQLASIGKELEYFSIYIVEPTNKNKEALSAIALGYKQMASDLLLLNVPEDISEIHKSMILNSTKTGLAIGFLAQYGDDPVLTTKGFILYQEASTLLEEAIYSLSAHFQKS